MIQVLHCRKYYVNTEKGPESVRTRLTKKVTPEQEYDQEVRRKVAAADKRGAKGKENMESSWYG